MEIIKELIEEIKNFIEEAASKKETWILLFLLGFLTVYTTNVENFDILKYILLFLKYTWWIWTFLIMFPIFRSTWIYWRQQLYQEAIKWKLLELKFPLEILKSPAAMEQVLRIIHSMRNVAGNFQEVYFDGEVTRWAALEMVSFGGDVHFYIRCYHKQAKVVTSSIYSYYQDVEVQEVEDYIDRLPANLQELYEQGYDMYGSEMILAKNPAYPIKTYPHFESPDEERIVDPISAFLEILGGLNKEDFVGIQVLIAPKSYAWAEAEELQGVVDELKEPSVAATGGEEKGFKLVQRTPGETTLLEIIEKNLSKPAFDTLIRFIYTAPKSVFDGDFARRGIAGAFNQYAGVNFNQFVHNHNVITRGEIWIYPHVAVGKRVEYRKQRVLANYRSRELPPETWMGKFISSYWPYNSNFGSKTFDMNAEAIATLFHPPTRYVLTAPHMRRIESKRAGTPGGLAIFGDEEDIEKYMEKK